MISTTLKLATLDQLQPVVKLKSEGNPYDSSGPTIKEMSDRRRKSVHPVASNSNIYEWVIFGRVPPHVERTSESHYVWGVEFPHNLPVITPHSPSHPLKRVAVKQFMHCMNYV